MVKELNLRQYLSVRKAERNGPLYVNTIINTILLLVHLYLMYITVWISNTFILYFFCQYIHLSNIIYMYMIVSFMLL